MPECVADALAYSICQTQWNVGGMGTPTGLNYTGCRTIIDIHRKRLELGGDAEVFEGLQIIEAATLNGLADVAKREQAEREMTKGRG